MTDSLQRDALIARIKNFGQTPAQLFKQPHPRRLPAERSSENLLCRAGKFVLSQIDIGVDGANPATHFKIDCGSNSISTEP